MIDNLSGRESKDNPISTPPQKVRLATVWLDGCSGCHMSFLDMDERLIALAGQIDLVYSPLVDRKDFPEDVDVTLIEGAVSSEEDLHKIKRIRERTRYLIALGDCAVTGNVPAMRNPFRVKDVKARAYLENASIPMREDFDSRVVPPLLAKVYPIHTVVHVDLHVQGCPPPADTIFFVLSELLAGREPNITGLTRFGK
jgi:NAD-reducing hydrogenase small subunit